MGKRELVKIKGFTLIELMIVVAIVGILAAIAIPKFADLVRKANEGATKGNLGALRSSVTIYYAEQSGTWPNPTASGSDITAGSLGYTLITNNGMFLSKMPYANCPPYHVPTNVATIAVGSANEAGGTGGQWGYQVNLIPAAGTLSTGSVWVNCTHTDSYTTTWGTY